MTKGIAASPHVWFESTRSWLPHSTAAAYTFFFICLFSGSRVLCITPSSSRSAPSLHPSLSPAWSAIRVPNRIRRDGRLEIHKLSIHHRRGVGSDGVEGGCAKARQGARKKGKRSGIKKGERKDNLRDRHGHKSPERGSKRLQRIWRRSEVKVNGWAACLGIFCCAKYDMLGDPGMAGSDLYICAVPWAQFFVGNHFQKS